VLDLDVPDVGRLEAGPHRCPRHRAPLAPAPLSPALGHALPAARQGPPAGQPRDHCPRPKDGRRESAVGRAPQDYGEARKWYRRAAEQGDAFAQFFLGVMYSNGRGVAQDYVQAHTWYNLGRLSPAPGGDEDTAVRSRDQLASLMTPTQIVDAQR